MNEYNTRILIVDDNKSIHEDFKKVLCPHNNEASKELDDLEQELFGSDETEQAEKVSIEYEVDSAFQGEEAYEMVKKAEAESRPYALAFMDVRMPPGWDGIETISRIWLEYPYIEIVLCTAYSDYTWDEIVEKLGSTDKLLFLRKPFDAIAVQQMALTLVKKWNLGLQARNYVKELETEVQERTRQLKKILIELEQKNSALKTANKELEHVALHDPLTKLPNRKLFADRLTHAVETAVRENTQFATFMLDVNKFKEINDKYGHDIGDGVLREFSRRIRDVLRESDTVARLGGDEFALILPNLAKDAPRILAEKIATALQPPLYVGELSLDVTTSIGVAIFPEHSKEEEHLLKCADIAMYQAKKNGEIYQIFDERENKSIIDRAQLVRDLDTAIRDEQLELHFQPIINLKEGRVSGMEALVRWNHPDRGLVYPDEFIQLAEQKGLIFPLTIWVFKNAVAQCETWHRQGLELQVSVNLSPRNLLDPKICVEFKKILSEYGVQPQWVHLEVTENMTIAHPERAMDVIRGLESLGLHLSVDDFGTGYSSLSYLKKLPVKELKIDKSFVMDMNSDNDDRIIVRSTIELAHGLGIEVVAEGVEDDKIAQQLEELGCDKVQGYHYCRPASAEDITKWLKESPWSNTPSVNVVND